MPTCGTLGPPWGTLNDVVVDALRHQVPPKGTSNWASNSLRLRDTQNGWLLPPGPLL
jgi:hypothetical protein